MKTIAFLLSLFVTATGLLGFISPGMLISMVRRFAGPLGVYAAAGIRLIMGLALYLSAPVSRIPHAVRALGDITLAAGAVTPFFGPERFRAALAWWSARGRPTYAHGRSLPWPSVFSRHGPWHPPAGSASPISPRNTKAESRTRVRVDRLSRHRCP